MAGGAVVSAGEVAGVAITGACGFAVEAGALQPTKPSPRSNAKREERMAAFSRRTARASIRAPRAGGASPVLPTLWDPKSRHARLRV
jgi:hypothetical protein